MAALKNKPNFLYWLMIAAGVYALLPYLLIAPYNQPAADDFSGAVRDVHQGLSAVFVDTYTHWSGRYFATLVARINPLLYHSYAAYKWYAVVLLVAFTSSLFFLVREFTKNYLSWKQTLGLSSLLLFLYLAVMPGTAEGFYWFSGSYVYQTANVFYMLVLAILSKLQKPISTTLRWVYLSVAVLLAVCIMGCNEISLIITCCVVVFVVANKNIVHKKRDVLLTTLAVVCIAAACIAVFAPGNFERMDTMQEYSKSPVWTATGAAGVTVVYLMQWLPAVLIATLFYVPLFGQPLADKILVQNNSANIKFRHAIVFFVALFIALQLFAAWVAGGSNLGRIENVIYLYFILGWFFNVQLFINEYHQLQKSSSFFSKPPTVVVIMLFVITVFDINNNISTAYIDVITGRAKQYSDELEARRQSINFCHDDTCYVLPLTTLPKTIFFTDIKCTTDSIDFWMNKVYAAYIGSGYVLVTAPLPPRKNKHANISRFCKSDEEQCF